MAQSLDFKEITNRDAWSTIRGFVYQVDYTILRWLKLESTEVLELERGEDIDIIQRDLLNHEITRDLEQIKYRESNLTLNSDVVLELMKNFYIHKTNNPDKNIQFRFLTNANYGHERPAIFNNGDKGIERWIGLYQLKAKWGNDKTVSTLKLHIQRRIKEQIPVLTSSATEEQQKIIDFWEGFHNYLNIPENLHGFLLNFEWPEEKLDQFGVVSLVLSTIEQNFEQEDARVMYERLFVFVFKLLTQKGLKTLDREILHNLIQDRLYNDGDQELKTTINLLLSQVDERLINLEKKSDEQTKALSEVFKNLEFLNNDTIYTHRIQQISTSPPELIKNGASRTEKIDIVLKFLEIIPWVAFQGINGSGKTQLASLIARSYQHVYWLDLREYFDDQRVTASAIEVYLAIISGCEQHSDKKEWIGLVVEHLPENSLLVFNDVPEIDNSVPGLNELFCFLINKLDSSTVRLITTSNFKFPDVIIQQCPEDRVFVFDDFAFDDGEIAEYLRNQGAPGEFLKMIPFIAARASRNPRLTTAMINHLKNINWAKDTDQLLETVLNTEFATGVLENAQQSIIRYINNQNSKSLLYRLSLINWPFGMEQVQAVSKVAFEILHPGERLKPLLNLWIQQKEKSRFEISPIIQNIGQQNLDPESLKKVHIAIGESILAAKTLNMVTGSRAFMSFINAKDYDKAGFVLLKIYQGSVIEEHARVIYNAGFLLYWTRIDFPKQMNFGIKVMLRREQLRLYELIGMDIMPLLDESKKLFINKDLSVIEGAAARMLLLTNYFQIIPISDYLDYMSFVLENLTEIEDVISVFQDEGMLINLIWLPVMRLNSLADVSSWINLLRKANAQGLETFESEIGLMTLGVLCHAIFKRDALNHDDQNGIFMLNELLMYFAAEKREKLAAYVVRGLSEVESRWYNDDNNAIKLVSQYLNKYDHPQARFILAGQLARLYKRIGDKDQEVIWLDEAFSYDASDKIELIDLLLQASVAVAESDLKAAVDYCQNAVSVAKNQAGYDQVDLILLLDELAVSLWLNGEHHKMFLVMEEIVGELFKARTEQPSVQWIRLFSLTGHVIGYCSAMISEGKPPQTGEEDYFTPTQGMFNTNSSDFSEHYNHKNDSYMLAQMAYIASGLGETEKAYQWSLKAFDEARSSGSQAIFRTVSVVCTHFAIIAYRPTEAFEGYLYNAAVMSHLRGIPSERYNALEQLPIESLFTDKPSEQWAEAEDTATTFATIPLFVMLLTAFKEERVEKNQMRAAYFKMISIFEYNASDQLLFDLVREISQNIIGNKISTKMLGSRANNFGDQGKRNLQVLCLLGVIHLTRNEEERLMQMINIVPYVQKVLSAAKNSLEYTLMPFVQVNTIDIVRTNFVGSRDELLAVEAKIYNVDKKDSRCLRHIFNAARTVVEVKIPQDRQSWLDGEEI